MRTMIEHYRKGVNDGPTLDPLVKDGIAITDDQVNDLLAFLRTLTDSSYINNPRFRQP
jgi:cytochrome c peroxidase